MNEIETLDLSNNDTKASTLLSVVDFDVGNLIAFDPRPVNAFDLKKDVDSYITNLTTSTAQLLIGKIFGLPTERVEDVIVAKLPPGLTVFPREKTLPKAKPPTKWEQYAKLKGIQKKKKGRKVFDETTKEWRPMWGFNKTKDKDTTNNWLIEIKKNEDPNQDFFSMKTKEKNERVAKNELQRLRNIGRASKKKIPLVGDVGLTPVNEDHKDKFMFKKALKMAKTADASMSKFSQKLQGEDKTTKGLGKKRKFESNYDSIKNEKEKQIKIFEKLTSTRDKPNKEKLSGINKASNKMIADEQQNTNKKSSKNKKRSSSGKHRRVSVKGRNKKRN